MTVIFYAFHLPLLLSPGLLCDNSQFRLQEERYTCKYTSGTCFHVEETDELLLVGLTTLYVAQHLGGVWECLSVVDALLVGEKKQR